MKLTYLHPDGFIEYDFDAGTCVVRSDDGIALGEPRAITQDERERLDPNYLTGQVSSLTDAVNQLILDALMGA